MSARSHFKKNIKILFSFPRIFILFIIQLYQKTLSPDHGFFRLFYPHGFCKFYPSCSVYVADAITCYGLIRGGWKGLKRILRCNPWSKGGIDPVQ